MSRTSLAAGVESESGLREWFDLLLQLKAEGLTPRQVGELVARGRCSNDDSGKVRDAFKTSPENSSWCF